MSTSKIEIFILRLNFEFYCEKNSIQWDLSSFLTDRLPPIIRNTVLDNNTANHLAWNIEIQKIGPSVQLYRYFPAFLLFPVSCSPAFLTVYITPRESLAYYAYNRADSGTHACARVFLIAHFRPEIPEICLGDCRYKLRYIVDTMRAQKKLISLPSTT